MRLVTFEAEGERRTGALVGSDAAASGGWVVDLHTAGLLQRARSSRTNPLVAGLDMIGLLAAGAAALEAARAVVEDCAPALEDGEAPAHLAGIAFRRDAVKLLAPVPRPPKIVCIARNYEEHVKEGGDRPVPERPVLFAKFPSNVIATGDTILLPRISDMVDWEGELAVIIGRPGRYIEEADALTHVAGYTVANDVSARDWQKATSQIMAGKAMDTFAPMGPALVTADEIPDPQALSLRTIVSGTLRQETSTGDMIFPVARLVSHVSQIATLEVGDVIMTGTPAGVGFWHDPKVFLKDGDTVRIEIDGVGVLENPAAKER